MTTEEFCSLAAASFEINSEQLCNLQVWIAYARWNAADGGGGPQQAGSVLTRARKVKPRVSHPLCKLWDDALSGAAEQLVSQNAIWPQSHALQQQLSWGPGSSPRQSSA